MLNQLLLLLHHQLVVNLLLLLALLILLEQRTHLPQLCSEFGWVSRAANPAVVHDDHLVAVIQETYLMGY
jgi:hypothetical protein